MTSKPYRQKGLTLLEMMVVLMIAAMAIALGFQSLGQWRKANAAISNISGATQQASLTESWLKTSLRSIIPVQEEPFEGSSDKIQGIAVQPVMSTQGGASKVEWHIQTTSNTLYLVLQEDGKSLQLALPQTKKAHFSYLDSEGKTFAQWPPKLGLHDHLPAAIVLTQEQESGPILLWASAIAGARNPLPAPFQSDDD